LIAKFLNEIIVLFLRDFVLYSNNFKGRRVKRDFNPSEAMNRIPGALINKYSQESTTAPTTNNMNRPYYAQPDATGIPTK